MGPISSKNIAKFSFLYFINVPTFIQQTPLAKVTLAYSPPRFTVILNFAVFY